MHLKLLLTVCPVVLILILSYESVTASNSTSKRKDPTVVIVILARNKAHTLPYYLTLLEQQDYPKDRISLWIRSDHNDDETLHVLRHWIVQVESMYHSVHSELLDAPPYVLNDEQRKFSWSSERFVHIIQLRQEALDAARSLWADFVFFVDCDIFITERQTLRNLISKDQTVVAPILNSQGLYSNYWCGMSEDYYYKRTEEYKPIMNREKIGCFPVTMVHSAVLINLQNEESGNLTFVPKNVPDYNGPQDDIITFAISAQKHGVPLHICNEDYYGYIMVPLEENNTLEDDYTQLTNLKVEAVVYGSRFPVNPVLQRFTRSPPVKDTLGFSAAFLVNLDRRPERRERMIQSFDELGVQPNYIGAVDGRSMNMKDIQKLGITVLPEYEDPYHKRPMTMGEIGCFLSHYNIWKEIVAKGYSSAIVFEDDIRFEPYFRSKLTHLMLEIGTLQLEWDLIYLGRKKLKDTYEPWLEKSKYLVWVDYSYWTLCYIITLEGAKKLLNADPLRKMVPVDEYLPIMFDRHPEETWRTPFPNRNLKAFSIAPLLVYPTHYTGESGYVSDTEDSLMFGPKGIYYQKSAANCEQHIADSLKDNKEQPRMKTEL